MKERERERERVFALEAFAGVTCSSICTGAYLSVRLAGDGFYYLPFYSSPLIWPPLRLFHLFLLLPLSFANKPPLPFSLTLPLFAQEKSASARASGNNKKCSCGGVSLSHPLPFLFHCVCEYVCTGWFPTHTKLCRMLEPDSRQFSTSSLFSEADYWWFELLFLILRSTLLCFPSYFISLLSENFKRFCFVSCKRNFSTATAGFPYNHFPLWYYALYKHISVLEIQKLAYNL